MWSRSHSSSNGHFDRWRAADEWHWQEWYDWTTEQLSMFTWLYMFQPSMVQGNSGAAQVDPTGQLLLDAQRRRVFTSVNCGRVSRTKTNHLLLPLRVGTTDRYYGSVRWRPFNGQIRLELLDRIDALPGNVVQLTAPALHSGERRHKLCGPLS